MSADSPLTARYTRCEGEVVITGVQALVRLMLAQAAQDKTKGLNSGGFVSGYRGSPLGTLDMAFASAGNLIDNAGIVVTPAVNEEMAATAIAGSQQIEQTNAARVDGVFSLWYGKGPGLDRASDAIRHGNLQGASPHGGVVVAVGDDHVAKSSTIVCCSDDVVAGLQMPLFYPADAAEIVAYGLHGFALSRLTGSWAALKIITEVADATRTIDTARMTVDPVLPDIAVPAFGLHNRWPEMPLQQEARHQEYRLPAVLDYVRANRLDRSELRDANSKIGLVAAGKTWLDLLEALRLIGLDERRLRAKGIALYKPALIWPLEPEGLRRFASGLDSLLIVEEKTGFIERQAKAALYGEAEMPAIWGKTGRGGQVLFPAMKDLTPEQIAIALARTLLSTAEDDRLREHLAAVEQAVGETKAFAQPPALRKPFFCSGCPHNRSTVVPEGSRALAGIGCHGLAAYNRPRTGSFAQMGGEGVHWMGLSPFTDEQHVFANMGDGTYFHSGSLAIRQAVATKLNITFKLLFNSAVAMTGGQSLDGELTVQKALEQLRSEGVGKVILVTEDPGRYGPNDPVRRLVAAIEHRDDLARVERDLIPNLGVSVILYEQMCATEKRRLRKRGKFPDPAKRLFINELVCEGCGDCSRKSNCLSVEPVATPLGTKRRINQSSCNKDYSCLEGFCPSFVTVEGVTPKRVGAAKVDLPSPPEPTPISIDHQRILVAGIGGTGVVTIGALLTMAFHLDGGRAAVLDQVGMAQKGGAVTSHIHLLAKSASSGETISALRLPAGSADLIIASDQIVGNAGDVLSTIAPGKTRILANSDVAITGDFTQDRDAIPDASMMTRRIARRAGSGCFVAYPFTRLAERLLGDAIGSNLMMVGFAYQSGWLGLDRASLDKALDLNGQAVTMNRAAFDWGRRLAIDAAFVHRHAGLSVERDTPLTLDAQIEERRRFLEAYQDAAYGARYIDAIARLRAAEQRCSDATKLSETAAQVLFRLMAYKDEYEVARLFTDESFHTALKGQFEGAPKLSFHMAPPLLARRHPVTGEPRKRRFGPWLMPVLRLLARMRWLRGTRIDPFGWTHERRNERALIVEYENLLGELGSDLTAETLDSAIALAALALDIRGYGPVKERAIEKYHASLAAMRTAAPVDGNRSATLEPRKIAHER